MYRIAIEKLLKWKRCFDPRQHGKGLTANRSGQWRYRIGDYRLICENNDNKLIILALSVSHRRDVYDWSLKVYNRNIEFLYELQNGAK